MDIDNDDIFNYNTSNTKRLKTFKVPKKIVASKSSFDKLTVTSTEFRDTVYPKVLSGFKCPNSTTQFKVLSAYNIHNVEVESVFNKRKQYFKKEYSPQSAVEYFGFIYISNLGDLRKIVKDGRIKNGNLQESVLGQPERGNIMEYTCSYITSVCVGVSVSQYADIFYSGDNKNYPRSGFLLIVKYIRGRVCYVVEDSNPMEPQPNYDCHISKVYNHDSFPSIGRAFHTTQVYLYEYSDDFDLIDEPTHVTPWAAVEFVWSGALLYKQVAVPLPTVNESLYKDPTSTTADKRIQLLARNTGTPSQRIKRSYADCTAILCTQLQLKLPAPKEESTDNVVLDIPITILTYNPLWSSFAPLMTSCWSLTDLMEWTNFEQEFLKPLTGDTHNEPFSLNDVFDKRIIISRSTETKVTSLLKQQFVNYLRLVVNDPSRDRAKMARLIDHFLETKTVARIRLCDSNDSLVFVFPDSTLSQNFGIPIVKTLDVNYLHVLIVTDKSLLYNQPNELIDEFLEVELKTNIMKLCSSQTGKSTVPLIPTHILTQSLRNQNHIQKSKLREMCGSVTNVPLKFETIDFENKKNNETAKEPVNATGKVLNGKMADDRPYDPSENRLGLSGGVKKGNHDRTEQEITESDAPANKVLKREDKKLELSNKLLELFARIKSPDESSELMLSKKEADDHYARTESATMFSKPLDRNRFQTQFRHGVSVYVPERHSPTQSSSLLPTPDLIPFRDRDLRFQDPINSGTVMRYKGVNR